ncbi:hypothetical protein HDV00_000399 [Rhizophlyctis rosea]|nr:hypothetical protein HDV00_000399 [Rhizophlyctis rosea]
MPTKPHIPGPTEGCSYTIADINYAQFIERQSLKAAVVRAAAVVANNNNNTRDCPFRLLKGDKFNGADKLQTADPNKYSIWEAAVKSEIGAYLSQPSLSESEKINLMWISHHYLPPTMEGAARRDFTEWRSTPGAARLIAVNERKAFFRHPATRFGATEPLGTDLRHRL